MTPNGYLLYEGPSVLDGEPIVAIATLRSGNRKTGDMIQTWILRADVDPLEAKDKHLDESVCGFCPARHALGGHCYVNLGQAPLSIWRSYQAGRYPAITRRTYRKLQGRAIRFGAYGDPAAVPYDVWKPLLDISGTHTGYTHQHQHAHFDPRIAEFCMLSIEHPLDYHQAWAREQRTFRTKHPDDPLLQGEILCPYDGGANEIQCIDCSMCKGKDAPSSIAIDVHGSRAKRYDIIFKEAA